MSDSLRHEGCCRYSETGAHTERFHGGHFLVLGSGAQVDRCFIFTTFNQSITHPWHSSFYFSHPSFIYLPSRWWKKELIILLDEMCKSVTLMIWDLFNLKLAYCSQEYMRIIYTEAIQRIDKKIIHRLETTVKIRLKCLSFPLCLSCFFFPFSLSPCCHLSLCTFVLTCFHQLS